MTQPISFRWDEDFIARIDKARGLVPRSTFVRALVDQGLSREITSLDFRHGVVSLDDHPPNPHTSASAVRSSDQSKRDVRPIPKRGK